MPTAEIGLPLAGIVLFGLLFVFVEGRAKRLIRHRPDAYLVISVHGFRAALDVLLLLLVWTLIEPGLGIPEMVYVLGTEFPLRWFLIPVVSLLLSLDLRLRILLARKPPDEK